jgi:hypothetical protein
MTTASKSAGVHYTVVICLFTSIACGVGWFQARQESNRSHDLNWRLAAEISQMRQVAAAEQQKTAERNAQNDNRIQALERRIAKLAVVRHGPSTQGADQARRGADFDGQVRWVDPIGKRVWISVGEADGVDRRTMFSVYKKTHSGVGRGTVKRGVQAEDFKGSIEVTRVMESHLSEARILTDDILPPIAKGDPIVLTRPRVE